MRERNGHRKIKTESKEDTVRKPRRLTDSPAMWTNARMRKLLADDFCPKCGKHAVLHDDKKCDMRFVKYEEVEACA